MIRLLQKSPLVEAKRKVFGLYQRIMVQSIKIYGLYDPRTPNHISYVGGARDPLSRLKQHSSLRSKLLVDQWIKKLPQEVGMIILEENSTWERERFWIALYRAYGEAELNISNGGDHFPNTVERMNHPAMRAIVSAAMKLAYLKPEALINKSFASKKAWENPNDKKRKLEKLKMALNRPEIRSKLSAKAKLRQRQNKENVKKALESLKLIGRKKIWANPMLRMNQSITLKLAWARRKNADSTHP
jgi:hypothetical protein